MASAPASTGSAFDERVVHAPLALDGHVHLQRQMPFAQIAGNFAKAAPGHSPICMVVESHGIDRFEELKGSFENWSELGLFDPATGLRFIAGRQVVSEEGLEVLLLGSRDQSLEGQPAERIAGIGLDSGAAVCIPWGFGKWLGERRRLASSLHAKLRAQLMLGDITNRPAFWPEPMLRNQRVLRGSDNLPLEGSSGDVGAFGSAVSPQGDVRTAECVIASLRDHSITLKPYGNRKAARNSIGEQIRLRFAKNEAEA